MSHKLFDMQWVVRGAFSNFSTQLLGMFLTFGQGVLIARLVGTQGKGAIALLVAAVLVPVALTSAGLGTSAQYHLASRKGDAKTIVSVVTLYALLVGGLLAWAVHHFNVPFIRWFLKDVANAGEFLPLAAPLVLTQMLDASLSQLLVSANRVRIRNIIQVVEACLGIVFIGCFVVWLHGGIHGAILAMTASSFVSAFLKGMVAIRQYGFTFRWDLVTLGQLFRYGIYNHGSNLLVFVFKRAEYFFLAYFLNVSAVGIYSVATSFVGLLLTVARSLQEVAMSAFAANHPVEAGKIVAKFSRVLLTGSIVMLIPAGMLGSYLIPHIYGSPFASAVLPYWILLLTLLCWGPGPYLTTYVVGIGHAAVGMKSTLAITILNVVLTVLLIPRFGLAGNAVATVAGYGLNVILGLILFRKFSGLPFREALLVSREDFGNIRQLVADFFKEKRVVFSFK